MMAVAWSLLASTIACHRSRSGAVHATLCSELCGTGADSDVDLSTVGCATEARVRVYSADHGPPPLTGARPLTERCVDLRAQGTRLSDLLARASNVGASGPLTIDGVTPGPVVVELALYEPGSAPCPADAPLAALGRSSIVDLRRDVEIDVPLGCRTSCQTRDGLALDVRRLEDDAPLAPPANMVLGEIYPYQAMLSPDGTCTATNLDRPRGQFRAYSAQRTAAGFSGQYAIDPNLPPGCIAARIVDADGSAATYACLSMSVSTATLWLVGDAQLLATLRAHAGTAANGALVVRISDRAGHAPVGATLTWAPTPSSNDAEYLQDDWTTIAPGALTSTGIAIVRDAPAGLYTVDFPFDPQLGSADGVTFMAGAADAPGSITTYSARP